MHVQMAKIAALFMVSPERTGEWLALGATKSLRPLAVPQLIRIMFSQPVLPGLIRTRYTQRSGQAMGLFWLPAAVIAGEGDDLNRAAERRALLMLWEPVATERGRRQVAEIVAV